MAWCVAAAVALVCATESPAAVSVANPQPIAIPGIGDATPYPSQIAVSGVTGRLVDVDVGVNGFQHQDSPDVGIVLVSPSGRAIVLMYGVAFFPGMTSSLIFDDQAVERLPYSGAHAGAWRPTLYDELPFFSPPGPGSSFGNPGPDQSGPHVTLNEVFEGENPNGLWNLFVRDFYAGDRGSVDGGWTLSLTIDAAAPKVDIGKVKLNEQKRTAKITFKAHDDVSGPDQLSYACKLDKKSAKPCSSPVRYKKLKSGKHKVRVTATDEAGNASKSAKAKFKVPARLTRS